jgi:VWFA-related protein
VRPLTLIISAIIVAVSLRGQNIPWDPTSTFKTGTRLVQVDVIVQDKKGPVEGLTKGDFTVLDNGVPQSIAIFSIREITKSPPARRLVAGAVANRPLSEDGDPVAGTVILFDRLNTLPEDQAYARVQALKYFQGASRNEHIAVYALGKTLSILENFTNDQGRLVQAVRRSSPEVSQFLAAEDLAAEESRSSVLEMRANARLRRQEITAAAFATLARHLSGLPGRKKLVWIASSVPLHFLEQRENSGLMTLQPGSNSAQMDKAIRALNDANIGVYPVDPRGVTPPPLVPAPGAILMDESRAAMNTVADMTGGKAHYGDNDVAGEIENVMTDTDLTYTLGFYPSEERLDGTFHTIAVQVNRRDVAVRSRRGYSASLPATQLTESRRHQLIDAWFQEPLEATDLSVRGILKPLPERPGYYSVEVAVDASELQLESKNGHWVGSIDLDVVPDVGSRTKGWHHAIPVNMTQEQYTQALRNGIAIARPIQAADASGKVKAVGFRIVVMDPASGKIGSVRLSIGTK